MIIRAREIQAKWIVSMAIACLGSGYASATAQETLSDSARPTYQLLQHALPCVAYVDYSGKLVCRLEESGDEETGNTPFLLVDFLVHPIMVEELSLKPDEIQETRELAEQFRRDLEEQFDPQNRGTNAERRQTIILLANRLASKLEQRVGSRRMKRWVELQYQALLFRVGLYAVLDDEQSFLTSREKLAGLHREEARLMKQALENWLEPLDETQVEQFFREWKQPLTQAGSLAFLQCSMGYREFANLKTLTNEELQPKQLLNGYTTYRLDEFGNLSGVIRIDGATDVPLNRYYLSCHLLNSDYICETLLISDDQRRQMRQIMRDFDAERSVVARATAERHGIPYEISTYHDPTTGEKREMAIFDWPKDVRQFNRENQRLLAEPANHALNDMLDVLTPVQSRSFTTQTRNTQIRSLGPAAELEHGQLKELLKLTPEQVAALESSCDRTREWLEQQSRTLAHEELNRTIRQQSMEVQQTLRSRLGRLSNLGPRNLSMLAGMLFRNGNAR